MSKVLCTICARGGSKGGKGKNVREICGKQLIAHTIEQAIASNLFEHIVISTDSDLIEEAAVKYGAEVFFKRDAAMASDTAGNLDVIKDVFLQRDELYGCKFDYEIDLDDNS
ncbi:cytidylyltransferase domain-containing protein, partial [Campylobacter concisus]|uniref:cytidylyltransferase domain-containing protein n=1 Tax=Campylobacter concisus TaxID=199 RepID=UPI003D2635FF